jgi:hypothetical protein
MISLVLLLELVEILLIIHVLQCGNWSDDWWTVPSQGFVVADECGVYGVTIWKLETVDNYPVASLVPAWRFHF